MKHNMDHYLAGDTFIIADLDKLHFFKKDGSFIKSVRNIEEIKGLTYVFIPDPLRTSPGQQIDIFSAEGKYLYKAEAKFDKGLRPRSLPIEGDYLYALLEDEDGEPRIAKYQIVLPGMVGK